MKPIRLWAALSIAALSLCVSDLPSQCTHTTVNAIGATVKPFGVQPCERGMTVTVHGLTLRLGHCPAYLLVTPAHHEPVAAPGCGTDAVVAGGLPVERHQVHCWRLDLFLLEVGGFCVVERPVVVRLINDWQVQPCR